MRLGRQDVGGAALCKPEASDGHAYKNRGRRTTWEGVCPAQGLTRSSGLMHSVVRRWTASKSQVARSERTPEAGRSRAPRRYFTFWRGALVKNAKFAALGDYMPGFTLGAIRQTAGQTFTKRLQKSQCQKTKSLKASAGATIPTPSY